MTIHHHGTPITPREQLLRMAGRHFCVSYAQPQDLKTCLRMAQSIMFDNGAFSTWRQGRPFDEPGYYAWLDPMLAPPHWAVIPDVIGGSEDEQRALVARWPHRADLGAPVWHLGLSLDYLLELAGAWPRVCFGSSAQFAQIGTPAWRTRMDQAFNALAQRHARLPWIHGLRMLGQGNGDWPLASADSANIARNRQALGCAECAAQRIDEVQTPTLWNPRPTQKPLL